MQNCSLRTLEIANEWSDYLNIYLSTLIPQLTNAANTAGLYQMVGGQSAKVSLEARGLPQGKALPETNAPISLQLQSTGTDEAPPETNAPVRP